MCVCACPSSCYRGCLELLLLHRCRSLAFCCVSTGIFGFPSLDAALCALHTVRGWLDEDERHRQAVDCIVLCVYLDKDRDVYERHMPLFFPLTPHELEGRAEVEAEAGGMSLAAEDASGSAVEAESKAGGGGDSRAGLAEQADGKQDAAAMEVSRGDTVWVRSDSSSAAQHAQPAGPNGAEAQSEQLQPAAGDGQRSRHAPFAACDSQAGPLTCLLLASSRVACCVCHTDEAHRKAVTASILARSLRFSRAPPPSVDAPHQPHAHRRAVVLFFSSSSGVTPHVAALLANSQHGEHVQALWTTSHADGPLVDETAAEVMQEMHIDDSDDAMTRVEALADMAASGRLDCVVALDALAEQQAEQAVGGSKVAVVCHEVHDPHAGRGGGGGERDMAHEQVRYRQSFNEVQAYVSDLVSVLEQLI